MYEIICATFIIKVPHLQKLVSTPFLLGAVVIIIDKRPFKTDTFQSPGVFPFLVFVDDCMPEK